MRIVEGRWAGRTLISPAGRVRPTSEEVRAAWLDELGDEVRGADVLDLFAGSGALGLEALSRGADRCDFVENGPSALHALKANVAALRARNATRIYKRDALDFAARVETPYAIAFADPPYGSGQLVRLIERWIARPFAGVLSVEHAAEHDLPGRGSTLRFGDTSVTFYRATGRIDRTGGR